MDGGGAVAVRNSYQELRGTAPAINRAPITGRVTKVNGDGVWVVPIGGDQRTPVGPCRGPSDIPIGTICMVIWTQERPWVFGAELVTTLTADSHDVEILHQAGLDAQARADAAQAAAVAASAPAAHVADHNNPHAVSKAQVGLGNVTNTSDANKPVSTATQAALDDKLDKTAYRDTGLRLVVEAGDLADLPHLEVVVRRRGDVVTVFTREATAAAHDGVTALFTLPAGFRPDAPAAPSPVVDEDEAPIAGAALTVTAAGEVRLAAMSGSRHFGAVTYLTSNAYPAALPGSED
jgi:hypothetical protein